jgi:predicted metalloprotease with PDZ domain
VQWQTQAPTVPQRLGLRVSESALTGVRITHVLRGGAAERAGASVSDEVLAVDGWRIRRLDDLLRVTVPGGKAALLVSRDQRVLSLPLSLPKDDAVTGAVNLTADAKAQKPALALRRAWLTG